MSAPPKRRPVFRWIVCLALLVYACEEYARQEEEDCLRHSGHAIDRETRQCQ